MHDIRLIRDNPQAFDQGLARRGLEPLSERLVALDEERRAAIARAQTLKERRGKLSKEFGPIIGRLKKERPELAGPSFTLSDIEEHGLTDYFGREKVEELRSIGEQIEAAETDEAAATKRLNGALAEIPNIPNPEVPGGRDEHDNVERQDHRFGEPRRLNSPRQHFELGEAMGLMDFETAAKLSGSRFVVLRGQLARLERALGQFMLDLHTGEHGYTEVSPPLLVREDAMFGTAQLPKFEDDQFLAARLANWNSLDDILSQKIDDFWTKIEITGEGLSRAVRTIASATRDYELDEGVLASVIAHFPGAKSMTATRWLIPTAEVPLTNLVRESILSEDELPLRVTALTPCFRAEAGAAGRDTRGMLRQHQFIKCELVSITTPEQSAQEHERMLASAEAVLQRLELPFRVMTLCTGDMGFASAKTYDIEVWMPGQNSYREISSCSVCNDFQARRMDARYRPKEGKGPRFVHTLNGSGVAVGRALIAVMENYQNEDGSVTIPSALRPYMGGLEKIG